MHAEFHLLTSRLNAQTQMQSNPAWCQQYAGNCWNCTSALGCHYCAFDRMCHAFGSLHGCTFGLECSDVYGCVRSAPVYMGPAAPSLTSGLVSVATALLVAVLWTLLYVCCTHLCRDKETRSARDVADSWDSDSMLRAHLPLVIGKMHSVQQHETGILAQDELMDDDDDFIPHRRRGCCGCCRSKTCCLQSVFLVAAMVVTITMAIMVALYFPVQPDYSLCNKKIEWSTVLSGLAHGHLTADVDLHLSLYNPNRFDVRVDHAVGTLLYRKNAVATFRTDHRLSFPSGSVTDVVLLAHFAPTATQALGMYADHLAETLLLDVGLEMETGVSVFQREIYGFNTTFVVDDIHANVPDSRAYCKCPG